MKLANRYVLFVIAVVIFAIGAGIFGAGVVAQEEGWQIVRAEYGFKNRRTDVTDVRKDLVGRGGVSDGAMSFVVTNNALGGDPAVGADKFLIVIYRYQGQEAATFVREGYTLTIP